MNKNKRNTPRSDEKPAQTQNNNTSKNRLTQVKNAHASGSGTLERNDLEQTGSTRKPISEEGMEEGEQY